jgi:hypothetical protein
MTGNGAGSTISGLPFTSNSATQEYWVASNAHDTWSNAVGGYVVKNGTDIVLQARNSTNTATSANGTSKYIMISATYKSA